MKHLYIPISARNVAVVLLAGLIAGAAFAPARILAQEAHPAAPVASEQNAQGQAEHSAQPDHAKDEEAEEHNAFRHTALVAAISDAIFRDDAHATDPEKVELREKHIEKTARGFEWINAAILFLAVLIPLMRILPRVMRQRSQTLKHNLDEARKTTTDANSRLSAVEAQLSRLDEEIDKIRSQVEEETRNDEARIKASIGEESARIVAAAELEIASAAAQAQRGLRHFAADLAIEQAAKQLILTPEADRALISEFVRETTGKGAKGGQN